MSALESYFWTSKSTRDFFSHTLDSAARIARTHRESQASQASDAAETIAETAPYADRAATWSSLIAYLSEKVEEASKSGQIADPCSLNTYPVIEKEVMLVCFCLYLFVFNCIYLH